MRTDNHQLNDNLVALFARFAENYWNLVVKYELSGV